MGFGCLFPSSCAPPSLGTAGGTSHPQLPQLFKNRIERAFQRSRHSPTGDGGGCRRPFSRFPGGGSPKAVQENDPRQYRKGPYGTRSENLSEARNLELHLWSKWFGYGRAEEEKCTVLFAYQRVPLTLKVEMTPNMRPLLPSHLSMTDQQRFLDGNVDDVRLPSIRISEIFTESGFWTGGFPLRPDV